MMSSNFYSFLLNFLKMIKGGKFSLEIEGKSVTVLMFKENSLLLDLRDPNAIASLLKTIRTRRETKKISWYPLGFRKIANMLKERGYTIFLLLGGKTIAVLGEEAKPDLLTRLMGLESIEIRDLKSILKLMIYSR